MWAFSLRVTIPERLTHTLLNLTYTKKKTSKPSKTLLWSTSDMMDTGQNFYGQKKEKYNRSRKDKIRIIAVFYDRKYRLLVIFTGK